MQKSLFLRVSEALHQRIAESAEAGNRSMNREAVALLEKALQVEEYGGRQAAIQRAVTELRAGGVTEGEIQRALQALQK